MKNITRIFLIFSLCLCFSNVQKTYAMQHQEVHKSFFKKCWKELKLHAECFQEAADKLNSELRCDYQEEVEVEGEINSLFHNLSDDLLAIIFEKVREQEKTKNYYLLKNPSRVCKRWRKIALKMTPLYQAILQDDIEEVKELIKKDYVFNITTIKMIIALYYKGKREVIRNLAQLHPFFNKQLNGMQYLKEIRFLLIFGFIFFPIFRMEARATDKLNWQLHKMICYKEQIDELNEQIKEKLRTNQG